jgi:hypothetical protein
LPNSCNANGKRKKLLLFDVVVGETGADIKI